MKEINKVIIGICAYNEEKRIGGLLSSLLNQSLSDNFSLERIIVVASGCTDRTEDVVREYTERSKGLIELISEGERRGKLSALNIILNKAEDYDYDYLVLANADIVCEKETLKKVLSPLLLDKSIWAACAKPLPDTKANNLINFIVLLMWFLHNTIAVKKPFLSGEFLAVRRGVLKRFPPFVPWEDIYINALLSLKGLKFVFVDDAIIYMKKLPLSLSEIFRQRVRYETGNLYIKKVLGYSKPTVSFSLILIIIPEALRAFGISKAPHYITAVLIDMFARIYARIKLHKDYIPFKW